MITNKGIFLFFIFNVNYNDFKKAKIMKNNFVIYYLHIW